MPRALISVYEKEGVEHLALGLRELGFELVSSGGTAAYLEENGLPVTRVEHVTGAPEVLGGRVKTLHPAIHAGILARRGLADDDRTLAEHGIEPFDVVCVNLYPFASFAARLGPTEEETIEMIDVGGPSMLRAAAKNFAHVAAVSDPRQYEVVLRELREHGEVSVDTRRRLAAEAFATTAAYEAAIATWFARGERFPMELTLSFRKVSDLPYGENPHQAAALYWEVGARKHLLSRVEQLGGKELSYNNLADLEGARRVARELADPAVVIVKHGNPCGVAVAATIEEAWERALAADPVSAYGCVAILNRTVTGTLGERIAEHFVEVLFAPGYAPDALDALARKQAMRILQDGERRKDTPGERDFRRVLGGLLVQDRDVDTQERASMKVACGEVPDETWDDLLFAWRVCKHVSSNGIVLARGLQTIGIGAGQMSRVDAVRIAVEKARALGHDTRGAVLASDAFFPFADGVEVAIDAGIAAIVQPGGSRRDAEVTAAVEAAGAAMVFTDRRHFRH
ncbi:MAG TPA: bifunctional phosphoribosylaminoimidazolecarboxamide formyltransferase/IMP cyclohydrolase [Gaiellaceae bacterium]|nr:bifunctional phosphoribosylaminoimidazolecarboxamide formyltransferase/IMP cyclohydrolase [Gaiellaceae bacterium]